MPPTRPGRSPSSATRPNQVYSWDITKLHGPAKWTYDLLLPLHDYRHLQPLRPRVDAGPGRTCQPGRGSHGRNHREPAHRARRAHHPLGPWITDDRPAGRPPAGRPRRHQISQPPAYEQRQPLLGKLLPDLQVPTGFPAAFGAYEDAYAHCGRFFGWYKYDHRRSGLGFHTPLDVHYARAERVREQRAHMLHAAYAAHSERFVSKVPTPQELPTVLMSRGPCAPWASDPRSGMRHRRGT